MGLSLCELQISPAESLRHAVALPLSMTIMMIARSTQKAKIGNTPEAGSYDEKGDAQRNRW